MQWPRTRPPSASIDAGSFRAATPLHGRAHVVASYATAAEAEEAVQLLIERKIEATCIAVSCASVVDSRAAEQRASRLHHALAGAAIGGLLGSVLGISLGLHLLILPGLALGALVGAWSAPVMPIPDGATDPELSLETERHDVLTPRDQVDDARRALHGEQFGPS